MGTRLPLKTTEEDLTAVVGYLKNQVGWTEIKQVKKAIPAKHADNRKIEALRFIGLLERDEDNVKLTEPGRAYAKASSARERAETIQVAISSVPLFWATLEWMHYQGHMSPTKTDVANYWHDHHSDEIGDAEGAALTDPAVFFLRMCGAAGIGEFVAAGRGRDTHLKVEASELEALVTGSRSSETGAVGHERPPGAEQVVHDTPPLGQRASVRNGASTASIVSPGLNVNIEIHIAADAEADTIEEIFRNMRRYVLGVEPHDGET